MSLNPFKIAIIFQELDLPFQIKPVTLADLKKPVYELINLNGRVPAIKDINTGITVWESEVIIEYLISEYDREEYKLNFLNRTPEAYAAKQ